MKIKTVRNFINKPYFRVFCLLMALVWFVTSVLFYVFYETATAHLAQNDPRNLQNRSEMEIFYAPLNIKVGENFTSKELAEYLNELVYENRPDEVAGSYKIEKNSIKIFPRAKAFLTGEIIFAKNRIKKILVGGKEVQQIEIEPLPMRNFIKYVNRESMKPELVRRIILSPEAVPEQLADAVTSAEDSRFYKHHGLDVFGIGYRLVTLRGGGSSITQQLIKNNVIKGSNEEFWQYYLGFLPEKVQRKLMEFPFALAAEEMMTKQQILASYLSMIPLAANEGVELHGVVTASQEYFGKSLYGLSLAEMATIAGMIHKPSFYVSLAKKGDYEQLTLRRNRVLDLMQRNLPEKYSAELIAQAKSERINFVFASSKRTERPADAYSRHFSAFVANRLPENLAEIRRTEGNLQIYTTLDYRLQKKATEIAENQVREMTKKVYTECLRQKPVNVDCNNVKPQISLVAMEAQTGEILAMYGGNSNEMNFSLTKRSPASVVKPFYYMKAFESGVWNGKPFLPETIINPETDFVSFKPENKAGAKSTVAVGLAKSYNFHAVAAAESVGIKEAVEFVGKLTNSTPEQSGVSAIGGSKGAETSLLDLVSAYSVFSTQGELIKPISNKFYFLNENKFYFGKVNKERVVSIESAAKTNEMMKLVLGKDGTAPNFKKASNLTGNNNISGKTGSGMVADCWFLALTPKVVVGVWFGLPNNEIKLELDNGFSGGITSSPVAANFFKELIKIKPELSK